ncbi:MAG: polymer-forming cytoskeletal protein [Pyrinomonadaceae bacterium]
MGKSSKSNEITETGTEDNYNPAVSFQTETNAAAFSESELMARDIKEGRLSGFVGNGTVLTGETTFSSMLRVDGHLKGHVSSEEGTLIIGSTGQVDAGISVAVAVINGAVNGDIVASDKLTLGRSARVVGDVKAPRLIIEDGAVLEGKCSMVEALEALETTKPADIQSSAYSSSKVEETEDTEASVPFKFEVDEEDSEEEANAAGF